MDTIMVQKVYIALVGDKDVGKTSLATDFICKYFNGNKLEEDATNERYISTIKTNMGTVEMNIITSNDFKQLETIESLKEIDCYIIMSDVSNENMRAFFKKWYTEIVYNNGYNSFIINCFNKIDISDRPTYIFDSTLPTFDISVRTTSGIINMLNYVLRDILKKENLLICM